MLFQKLFEASQRLPGCPRRGGNRPWKSLWTFELSKQHHDHHQYHHPNSLSLLSSLKKPSRSPGRVCELPLLRTDHPKQVHDRHRPGEQA